MEIYDLAVVGEGVAGLTCAGAAAEHGLRTATIEGNLFGGLVVNVGKLDGYEPVAGIDLASRLMESNTDGGVTSLSATVTALSGSRGRFQVVSDGGEYVARSVVIASGARRNKLNVPGETEFDHRGVSHCADCDGPFFKGEHVIVVGGGDAAFMEATVLSQFASKVTIVMRGDAPRARPQFVAAAKDLPGIEIMSGTIVEEILGGDQVTGVRVRSDGTPGVIETCGVFIYAGLVPNSEMAPQSMKRTALGHIETDASFESSLPGVFAIGAVRSGYSGRLVDAVAEAKAVAQRIAGA